MLPFCGVFLDKDGNEHDLTEMSFGPKIDPLINPAVLDGVFGDGVFDAGQVTITKFGPTDAATIKYFGGVCVGSGRVVAIPSNASQPALIDVNAMTVTPFGSTDTQAGKYRGGVYIGGGKVVAIPFNSTQPAMIDINDLTITKFGFADSGTNKYTGGVYVGDVTNWGNQYKSNVVAVQFTSNRPAMIYPDIMDISRFGSITDANASKFFGGAYIGDGKAVVISHNSSRVSLVDTNDMSFTWVGQAGTATGKYAGGVYIDENRVVTIPFSSTNPGIIDTNTITISTFGAADAAASKYAGGVYVGDGKVVAIPFNASQPSLIDANSRIITKFGPADAAAGKYYGGVYAGDGKILAIPSGASQFALIDLGPSYRPAKPLTEAALLSAWFNKF